MSKKPDTEMNRTKEHLDAEVAKTMKILDEMPRIEPHHLFRARLLQRIEAAGAADAPAGGFMPRLAFFSLLLAVNVGMGVLLFTHQDTQPTANRNGAVAESYSEDYGGPALSYYDQPTIYQNDNQNDNETP
jgi:hypothetical protein